MKYLVLRPFRSYGVAYKKGEIIDEKDIRSPYLRRSEGKIVPAVSSANVPDVEDETIEAPAQSTEDENTTVEGAQTETVVSAETPVLEGAPEIKQAEPVIEAVHNDEPVPDIEGAPEKFDIVDETGEQQDAEPVPPVLTFTQPSN